MLVLGIPHVVVLKTVHVDVQAIRVHVHVGNEELCSAPSAPPSFEGYQTQSNDCIVFGTSKVRERAAPTKLFFNFEKPSPLFCKLLPTKFSLTVSNKRDSEVVTAE